MWERKKMDEKKELKVNDFPFDPPEEVKVGFRNCHKTTRTIRILMEALFEVASSVEDMDPWQRVRKSIPELTDFTIEHPEINVRYSYISEQFIISPAITPK